VYFVRGIQILGSVSRDSRPPRDASIAVRAKPVQLASVTSTYVPRNHPDWDVASGKELRQFAGPEVFARTLAFSPDGKLLAAGRLDGRIRLWRVDTGTLLRDLPAHDRAVTALAFSPDGRLLASGARDTTMLLWDVRAVAREAPAP
jgi:WD40 repeat protein